MCSHRYLLSCYLLVTFNILAFLKSNQCDTKNQIEFVNVVVSPLIIEHVHAGTFSIIISY